jgi:hypothetical protein
VQERRARQDADRDAAGAREKATKLREDLDESRTGLATARDQARAAGEEVGRACTEAVTALAEWDAARTRTQDECEHADQQLGDRQRLYEERLVDRRGQAAKGSPLGASRPARTSPQPRGRPDSNSGSCAEPTGARSSGTPRRTREGQD